MSGILAQRQACRYALRMATVSETLRKALVRCGESRYAVSMATGIDQAVLSRFHHGQPLRGENLDKLAEYLGLELRPKARRSPPRWRHRCPKAGWPLPR